MSSKNRGPGRPRVDSERVDTRFPRELLDLIDAWAADQDDKPSRPEAVRRLVAEALGRPMFSHPE